MLYFLSPQNPTNNQRRWRLCLDSPDHEAIQGLLAEGIQKKGLLYWALLNLSVSCTLEKQRVIMRMKFGRDFTLETSE